MPSSYTQSLRLVLPVTGENTGTWGDIVNAGLTELVEDAIAGTAVVAMSDANSTLTVANEAVDQARNMFLTLTGTLTAQRDLVVPSVSKLYFVGNGTAGGFGVQVKTLFGAGVVIPAGLRMPVYCDGSDVSFALGTSVGRAVLMAASQGEARTALGAPAEAQGFQPGDIKWQAHTTVDTGWLAADGGAHSRTVYAALFARIGTTFGAGDGSTTFNVPDMRDRMAIGSGNLYALGASGGSKDAIVVSHTHGTNDPGHTHDFSLGLDVASGTGFQKLLPGSSGYNKTTNSRGTGITIQSTGSSGTNANLPPYRALFAVIKY